MSNEHTSTYSQPRVSSQYYMHLYFQCSNIFIKHLKFDAIKDMMKWINLWVHKKNLQIGYEDEMSVHHLRYRKQYKVCGMRVCFIKSLIILLNFVHKYVYSGQIYRWRSVFMGLFFAFCSILCVCVCEWVCFSIDLLANQIRHFEKKTHCAICVCGLFLNNYYLWKENEEYDKHASKQRKFT